MKATITKFEGPYNNIGKIPTPWKGQWLVKRGSSHGLTQEVMERAEANDQYFVCWLFRVALQMDDQTALPKDLIESTEASNLLTARSEEVGDRIQHLMREGGLTSDGRVHINKGTAFELVKAGDMVENLIHCIDGDEVDVPDYCPNNKTFYRTQCPH